MHTRSRTFTRRLDDARLDDLAGIFETVIEACDAAAAPPSVRTDLRLAVEEAYTNIVLHGYGRGRTGPVLLTVTVTPSEVTVRLEDEAPAFRPEGVPAPGLADDWSERKIGGLGWHLIAQVMDEVHHMPRSPVGNVLVFMKRLPASS
jgi:serine/threonine-protein kinase RsbW